MGGFGSVGPGNGMWVVGLKYVMDESLLKPGVLMEIVILLRLNTP